MTLFDLQKKIDAFETRHGRLPARIRMNPKVLKELTGVNEDTVREASFLAIPIELDSTIKSIRLENK